MHDQGEQRQTWRFRKTKNQVELICLLHLYSDGTAIIEGDEDEVDEVVFEESSEALKEAEAYLNQLGYVMVSPHSNDEFKRD